VAEVFNSFLSEPQAISVLIETNLIEHSFYLNKVNHGENLESDNFKWVLSASPIFNRILGASFAPIEENLDDGIQKALNPFKMAQVPVTWLIGPSTKPPDLGQRLQRHGFVHRGYWKGMALDLNLLNPYPLHPPGLSVRRVTNLSGLETWLKIAGAGFQFPATLTRAYNSYFKNVSFTENSPWQLYIALLNGIPVSTCTLFLGSEAVGIYWTATVAGANRRGVASFLTWQLLQHAANQGYRMAVLHSTNAGHPMYQRLGFNDYCNIDIYTYDARPWLVQIKTKVAARLSHMIQANGRQNLL
jgi:hypothetical protein